MHAQWNRLKAIDMGDIFIRLKNDLLKYAPFIIHCQNAEITIGKISKMDSSLNEQLERLQIFLTSERHRTKDKTLPYSINALLTFPMQHVLR